MLEVVKSMRFSIDEKTWQEALSGTFKGEVRFMELMKNHTSLRIGGPADVFAIPQDLNSLRNMLIAFKEGETPFSPIGGGTNMLVRDGGIEGVVISSRAFRKVETLREDDEYVYLFVEAGAPLQRLVHFSREHGYSGIEGLAGIPGTVGGAICGNAGAYGYEMKDVITSVSIMDAEGRIRTAKRDALAFGYRRSSITSDELLLDAEIKLKKERKEEVAAKVENFVKKKWGSQPLSEPSAGCVFKNPPQLSAGKLIDEAGCKGMRIGDVEVSSIHANFFINKGEATASDFIRLMQEVAYRVKQISGVVLEPEIRIIGRDEG